MSLSDEDRGAILALEQRFWFEGGGDPAFWREHFADDGVVALRFGLMDKDQTVEAMAQGQAWTEMEMEDVRVVALGDDAAAVAYTARAVRDDGSGYEAVVGSAYSRRGGQWQLCFHQQTPGG